MTATAIGSYATTASLKAMIGTTDSDDDAVLGLVCDRVNQYIESYTRSVLAPISSTTYLYDGDGSNRIYLPFPVDKAPIGGLRAVTQVEIAPYTGATFDVGTLGDFLLRGKKSMTGPYQWLQFSDRPLGTYTSYRAGLQNIRVTGTAGWAAIPDDIIEVALAIAQRAWNNRQSGLQDAQGLDENGRPVVARFLSGRDFETLNRYKAQYPAVIG